MVGNNLGNDADGALGVSRVCDGTLNPQTIFAENGASIAAANVVHSKSRRGDDPGSAEPGKGEKSGQDKEDSHSKELENAAQTHRRRRRCGGLRLADRTSRSRDRGAAMWAGSGLI